MIISLELSRLIFQVLLRFKRLQVELGHEPVLQLVIAEERVGKCADKHPEGQ